MINAWANHVNFCPGQISVDTKSNEIPAVQELLQILNLKGAVVTTDAMHCQKQTTKIIIDREADYVIPVKGNQPKPLAAIVDHFDKWGKNSFSDKRVRSQTKKEKNRGRQETRTCIVGPAPTALKNKFAALQTIGLIRRERVLADGTEQSEISYFISRLAARVRVPARHLRNHWSVENTLHSTLDVSFTEDASRIRKGNDSDMISTLRRLALSILKQDTTFKDNVRRKRLTTGWNLTKLESMLLAFQAG